MRKVLPPTYFLSAIVLAVLLHFVVPARQVVGSFWRFLGMVPLAVGVFLNLAADQAFKKHKTTVKPFEESNVLVTEGVFRISRHPMYLGMVLILMGVALLLGSVTPFAVVAVLAVVFDRVFITAEERMLKQNFEEQYGEYRKRVRRWI